MRQAQYELRPPRCAMCRTETLDAVPRSDSLKPIVEAAVSVVFAIDVGGMQSGSRGRAQVAQARQVAMYLAHCAFSLSQTEVGRIFNRDRTTVAHACALVEDRRDDPLFDRTLSNLEEIVQRLATISGCRRDL